MLNILLTGMLCDMPKLLDVALLPSEALSMEADCYIVVDVLRATTTIATLFARGLADLVVCDNIEVARRRAHDEQRLLFGEVGGLPPEGFDYGNSPVEASNLDLAGSSALMFTTNGTAALCALAHRGVVVTGAPANTAAVGRFAANYDQVVVVCAGNAGGTRFSAEDFAAAGMIVGDLAGIGPNYAVGDAARLARTVSVDRDLITGSAHALSLTALDLRTDIEFAARHDTSAAVPGVVESGPGWARLVDAAKS